jgi:deoxyribonuclease IV
MDDAQPSHALAYDDEDEYRPEPEPAPQPAAWRDGSTRIGIHTSIAADITSSLESARKLGCNALQIFSASPRMWPRAGSRIAESDAARFRARRMELGLGPLVIHTNYLVNLASSDPVLRTRSIQTFHDEMVRALALGADFLVVHPGSAGSAAPADAVRAVAQGLRQASRGIRFADGDVNHKNIDGTGRTPWGGLRVLLENTAGMGSAVGSRFEELRAILDQAPELPLGMCLDTAHAFESGYEIHTADGLTRTIADLDRAVGLARVAVVHVNDSKTPLGSRVDRHEHIGRGKIGLEAFGRILTHPQLVAGGPSGLAGRAFILETPIDEPGDDRRNVRNVWELAGLSVKQAPDAENGFSMLRASARAASTREGKKESATKTSARANGTKVAKKIRA